MQVSIETTSGLERRLTIGIPAIQVESEVEKRLKQAAKTVRLNGFRKGKVPFKVVKQRFGVGVRQEVLGEVINRSFYEAVQQQDVKPAGRPSIEATQLDEGKDVEFVATFEVYPEVEIGDFRGYEISRFVAEVTDADVDNMIEVLRKQQAGWNMVERPAADGDQVNIDYQGTHDGEAFEGGTAESQDLVIGSKSMVEGFESGIIGMNAGEEKVLNVTFPEDYPAENLKGAAVEFKIKVNSISERELPELDQDFFEKYGVSEGGEEKFLQEVKSNMERELKNRITARVKDQVMDALVKNHTVELPKALVANEVNVLRDQMLQQFRGLENQKVDIKSLLPDQMFTAEAERRVALGLIVGEIVKKAEIKLDHDQVRAMVEELASTYQEPEEVVNYYYSKRELMAGVESAVLENQVVDYILSSANVEEVQSTYEEVIKHDHHTHADGGMASGEMQATPGAAVEASLEETASENETTAMAQDNNVVESQQTVNGDK